MKPEPIITYFGVDLVPLVFRRVGVRGRPTGQFVTLANGQAFQHFADVNHVGLKADNDR